MFEDIGNNPNYHQRITMSFITFQEDEQQRGLKKDNVSEAREPKAGMSPQNRIKRCPLPRRRRTLPPRRLLPLLPPVKGPYRLHVLLMIHEHYMHDHKVKLPTTKLS